MLQETVLLAMLATADSTTPPRVVHDTVFVTQVQHAVPTQRPNPKIAGYLLGAGAALGGGAIFVHALDHRPYRYEVDSHGNPHLARPFTAGMAAGMAISAAGVALVLAL